MASFLNIHRVSRGGRLGLVIFTALASAIFIGCGGSGGGETTQLAGNAAVRAASISSDQSLAAGMAYPMQVLQMTAPTGNKLPAGAGSQTALRTILNMAAASRKKPLGTVTFVSELNLYVGDVVQSGTTFTMPFFTDSAGTISAGSLVAIVPGGSTNFTNYPVTVTATINLTAGNLPCKGSCKIAFTDSSGANTMTGALTLTSDNVVESVNLTLDDSANVGGSITVQESNATVSATNVAGNLLGNLTCNVTVTPNNFTGTGTINLITGAISLRLQTPNGIANASSDSSGNLDITYGDGTAETVTSPLTSTLTSSTGTSTATGGTATGGTVLYQAPVLVVSNANNNYAFNFAGTPVNVSGDFLLNTQNPSTRVSTGGLVVLGATPTSPVPLQSTSIPFSLNSHDAVGGNNGNFWASPTSTLQTFSTFALGFQQIAGPLFVADSGLIVSGTGFFNEEGAMTSGAADVITYSAAGQPPARVATPTNAGPITLNWMSPGGAFVGQAYGSTDSQIATSFVYWSNAQASGTLVALPPSFAGTQTLFTNDSGQLTGTCESAGLFPSFYWSSPAATPVQLPGLHGTQDGFVYVHGISGNGTIVGEDRFDGESGSKAVRWVGGQIQDLNTLIPTGTGWVLEKAWGISANGIIVGYGSLNGTESIFILKPKS